MKVIIFAKTISVNLAVENKVINVITIFENSSGNENHDKSIMEEPLNSAKPSNKLFFIFYPFLQESKHSPKTGELYCQMTRNQ